VQRGHRRRALETDLIAFRNDGAKFRKPDHQTQDEQEVPQTEYDDQ
jgi:hypothetical protein